MGNGKRYAKFQENLFSDNEIKSISAIHFFANGLYRVASDLISWALGIISSMICLTNISTLSFIHIAWDLFHTYTYHCVLTLTLLFKCTSSFFANITLIK